MSIELYIQSFSDGEPSGIPEAQVLSIFAISGEPDGDGLYSLDFGPGIDCQMSIDSDGGRAAAVTIIRPVTADPLWLAVFELLSRGGFIAYSSEGRAAVATASVLQELPPDMVESFEEIAEVASAKELIEALFE